jgi:hypothetical protein
MPGDKDHLGEQLKQREQAAENRYFEEQSRKQIEKLRQAHATAVAASIAVDCPRCGAALEERTQRGVTLDACPKGHGLWLDAGELEEVTKREGEGWLARLLLGKK